MAAKVAVKGRFVAVKKVEFCKNEVGRYAMN